MNASLREVAFDSLAGSGISNETIKSNEQVMTAYVIAIDLSQLDVARLIIHRFLIS
jgi:hypothetical protein